MREIVDKHFPDNWVIAFYMGFCVDLTVEWEPYKAAKTALNNTTTQENISSFKARYVKRVEPLIQALGGFLTEGVLVEEFILEKRNKLMACLRDCNVTLRWLMLRAFPPSRARILVPMSYNHGGLLFAYHGTCLICRHSPKCWQGEAILERGR
jgi:WASH complex subunit strumpellin